MNWQNPKTNWAAGDGIMASDLNRIEGNIKENSEAMTHVISFGGTVGESMSLVTNQALVVAIRKIWLYPNYKLTFNIGGYFPQGNDGDGVAFLVIRDTVPANNISYQTLSNNAWYSVNFSFNPQKLLTIPVDEMVSKYAIIGFANTHRSMNIFSNHQIHATAYIERYDALPPNFPLP
jgi:hypothetical protein